MLHGELEIGSEATPHTRNATITLTNNVPGEDVMTMGDRGIMLMGGTLSLHGNRKDSWTKLAKTAAAGSNTIEVLNTGDWKKGDEIVVASTDFDPHQAERRTISSISGKVITLDQKLQYMHYGQVTFGVDERGEVGMISRNIRIQASADAEKSFSGGHVMAMARVDHAGLWCRVLSNGSAREPCEVSDPLASGWRYAGAIHSELCDSRHLQSLRDGTWYEQYPG